MKRLTCSFIRTLSVSACVALAWSGFSASLFAATAVLRSTTDANRWANGGSITTTAWSSKTNYIEIVPGTQYQVIQGFGGAFSEMGWQCMQVLSAATRDSIVRALVDTSGCNFTICRTPLAGNDFCYDGGRLGWDACFTYNDNSGDYAMTKFSITRDRSYLIPFIKAALAVRPDLKLWASPWVAPSWLTSGIHSNQSNAYTALALYYKLYVQAYQAEGVNLIGIATQNEPDISGPFNAASQEIQFIKNYWGPLFKSENISVQIWNGTYWNPNHLDEYILPIMNDTAAKKYISYIGLQGCCNQSWQSNLHSSFPNQKIIETEGLAWENPDWTGGMNNFNNVCGWIGSWANMYMVWNMVLAEKGAPSRDQGALVHVTQATKRVDYTPSYYALRHFSYYVKPNAQRIGCTDNSGFSGRKLAFKNPNGDYVLVFSNTSSTQQQVSVKIGSDLYQGTVPGNSINTLLCQTGSTRIVKSSPPSPRAQTASAPRSVDIAVSTASVSMIVRSPGRHEIMVMSARGIPLACYCGSEPARYEYEVLHSGSGVYFVKIVTSCGKQVRRVVVR